jgi:hemolysin III
VVYSKFSSLWHLSHYALHRIYSLPRKHQLTPKSFLNKLDHSAIYLLIAGTYTPYTLITLRGAWGWSIFGVIWFLAIVGVVFKLNFYKKKYRKISALLYILMGWIVVVAFVPLTHALPTMGIVWLIAGGLAYSIGVLFYIPENLPYSHGIFHLFIIAGSLFHFFSVMGYVLQ